MKKAKVLLTAFAALIVVGSTLAFSAKKFSATIFTSTNQGLTCDQPTPGFQIDRVQAGTGIYASTTPSNNCPEVLTSVNP
jgi:hypothetical protein